MLNKIVIGKYHIGTSFIHTINPLCKIICVFLLVVNSFFITSINDIILSAVVTIILVILSKVSIKNYIALFRGIVVLIFSIILINLLVGTNIYETGLIVFRLLFIVIVTSVLTLTTTPLNITYGLEKLLKPFYIFKVPVNEIALSISLVLRFIPTIICQTDTILKSQSSRGLDYTTSKYREKLKIILSIILPVFVISFKKADILADTMIIRQYDFKINRTNYHVGKWNLKDSLVISTVIITLVIGVIL